jgi:hypothetical protein
MAKTKCSSLYTNCTRWNWQTQAQRSGQNEFAKWRTNGCKGREERLKMVENYGLRERENYGDGKPQRRELYCWRGDSLFCESERKIYVRFKILTAASMKMAVFWVIASRSLVEGYRRFRGTCCLHHQGPNDGQQSRRQPSSKNILFLSYTSVRGSVSHIAWQCPSQCVLTLPM